MPCFDLFRFPPPPACPRSVRFAFVCPYRSMFWLSCSSPYRALSVAVFSSAAIAALAMSDTESSDIDLLGRDAVVVSVALLVAPAVPTAIAGPSSNKRRRDDAMSIALVGGSSAGAHSRRKIQFQGKRSIAVLMARGAKQTRFARQCKAKVKTAVEKAYQTGRAHNHIRGRHRLQVQPRTLEVTCQALRGASKMTTSERLIAMYGRMVSDSSTALRLCTDEKGVRRMRAFGAGALLHMQW